MDFQVDFNNANQTANENEIRSRIRNIRRFLTLAQNRLNRLQVIECALKKSKPYIRCKKIILNSFFFQNKCSCSCIFTCRYTFLFIIQFITVLNQVYANIHLFNLNFSIFTRARIFFLIFLSNWLSLFFHDFLVVVHY